MAAARLQGSKSVARWVNNANVPMVSLALAVLCSYTAVTQDTAPAMEITPSSVWLGKRASVCCYAPGLGNKSCRGSSMTVDISLPNATRTNSSHCAPPGVGAQCKCQDIKVVRLTHHGSLVKCTCTYYSQVPGDYAAMRVTARATLRVFRMDDPQISLVPISLVQIPIEIKFILFYDCKVTIATSDTVTNFNLTWVEDPIIKPRSFSTRSLDVPESPPLQGWELGRRMSVFNEPALQSSTDFNRLQCCVKHLPTNMSVCVPLTTQPTETKAKAVAPWTTASKPATTPAPPTGWVWWNAVFWISLMVLFFLCVTCGVFKRERRRMRLADERTPGSTGASTDTAHRGSRSSTNSNNETRFDPMDSPFPPPVDRGGLDHSSAC